MYGLSRQVISHDSGLSRQVSLYLPAFSALLCIHVQCNELTMGYNSTKVNISLPLFQVGFEKVLKDRLGRIER